MKKNANAQYLIKSCCNVASSAEKSLATTVASSTNAQDTAAVLRLESAVVAQPCKIKYFEETNQKKTKELQSRKTGIFIWKVSW
jgi:hypothetical protein